MVTGTGSFISDAHSRNPLGCGLPAIRQSGAKTDIAIGIGAGIIAVRVEHARLDAIVPVAPTLQNAISLSSLDISATDEAAYDTAYLPALIRPNVIFFKRQVSEFHTEPEIKFQLLVIDIQLLKRSLFVILCGDLD